ncbi:TPA: decarboxylating 6-phosphogluconate dehydrogenase, partial [Candidatus Woesearchaeota archaeon]|nr:decarboxylating 6-phosphogluconate dehydrogenase [Candidatus Woesearchaeota archaeon]
MGNGHHALAPLQTLMELGFIGLGRMGGSMAARMLKSKGMRVVVWNRSPEPVKEAVAKGAIGSASLRELVGLLKQKRKIVWMMLPSGDVTEKAFRELLTLLKKGDIIIEGANSNFNDSIRRHKEAAKKGIEMLDVGVSGGVVAAKRGYALMAGGTKQTYDHCKPLFDAIGYPEGYGLVGGPGAGHYVKMVHNAIEYGMMQSIAEGFDLLKKGSYPHVDAKQVAHLWNHGTIVQSFLMEMVENALSKDGNLTALQPFVADSGEGKWAAVEAMDKSIPFVANTYALHARYLSRDKDSFAFKLLAAMR